ncbi:MAG: hypothetical protein EPN37_04535 [Chitinophagaceae bacterium]|nr:MAG: hypothetical protein EPN37_04535 [Chitinophagaceae bacterium]
MFRLCSYITIGNVSMNSVHEVRVNRSIHSYIDTAKIKIPASAYLKYSSPLPPTQSIQRPDGRYSTAYLFQRGDQVQIQLGYDNELKTEFTGFINRINFTTPLEIECEGYSWLLRQKTINVSWKSITLKGILQYLIQGTPITLSQNIPEISLNNIFFRGTTADNVLGWIKDKLLMTIFFNGSELYAGLEFTQYKGTEKYKLGWNVIKDDNLKYHIATDTKIKIKAISISGNGSKIEAEVGDSTGVTHSVYFYNEKSLAQLKADAQKKLQHFKYDGYEGKITAFLQPYLEHGYKVILDDPQYAERSGSYLIEGVEVSFGTSGARRTCEIGIKVS